MKKQTAGRDILGTFAPKFAQLNDDVLFGEVWSRETELSLRDRSMITVTALITKGIFDSSLKYHLNSAKNNGISAEEIAELITHLAFYVGWPNAWAAFPLAKEVFSTPEGDKKEIPMKREDMEHVSVFPLGDENIALAPYFIGKSYVSLINDKEIEIYNVTFEPGCRNNWHIHHGKGQILICVSGHGWYQEFGGSARQLKSGDIVYIAAETKHWHGAVKDEAFAHLSLIVKGEHSHEWLEPITDEEYARLSL